MLILIYFFQYLKFKLNQSLRIFMTKVKGYFIPNWGSKNSECLKRLPLLAPFPISGLIQWHYKAVTVYLLLISDCWSDRFSQASSPCSCSVTWDEAVSGCAKWLTLLHYQWGPITFRGLSSNICCFVFWFVWLKKGGFCTHPTHFCNNELELFFVLCVNQKKRAVWLICYRLISMFKSL